jgi:MtN3 and saliva related transmembrane protein
MPLEEWLGFLGGAVTTIGFIPQVVRLYKIKSAREISLTFSILFLIGITFWLVYGISFNLFPVILWNSITLVLVLALLYAKLRYGK